eukprot:751832-Hanusia_phi.AAC.3
MRAGGPLTRTKEPERAETSMILPLTKSWEGATTRKRLEAAERVKTASEKEATPAEAERMNDLPSERFPQLVTSSVSATWLEGTPRQKTEESLQVEMTLP